MTQASPRQLGALGFCAFSVPAVLLLPHLGWLWASIAAVCVAALMLLALHLCRKNELPLAPTAAKWKLGRVLLLLALIWNLLLLGAAAKQLCAAFPDGKNTPLVGLLLLLLAVYAAKRGRGPRVAAIVFFFLLGIYALLFGFSLTELRGEYLIPETQVDFVGLTAALAPTSLLYLCRGGRGTGLTWIMGGILLAFAAAFMTAGILSAPVAAQQDFALYEAAKSVSIFGVIGRLEPLVSTAVSMGGFCMLCLLCSANGQMLSSLSPKAEKWIVPINLFVPMGFLWLSSFISGVVIAVGTTIFWGIFPLATLLLGTRKKFEKK